MMKTIVKMLIWIALLSIGVAAVMYLYFSDTISHEWWPAELTREAVSYEK